MNKSGDADYEEVCVNVSMQINFCLLILLGPFQLSPWKLKYIFLNSYHIMIHLLSPVPPKAIVLHSSRSDCVKETAVHL